MYQTAAIIDLLDFIFTWIIYSLCWHPSCPTLLHLRSGLNNLIFLASYGMAGNATWMWGILSLEHSSLFSRQLVWEKRTSTTLLDRERMLLASQPVSNFVKTPPDPFQCSYITVTVGVTLYIWAIMGYSCSFYKKGAAVMCMVSKQFLDIFYYCWFLEILLLLACTHGFWNQCWAANADMTRIKCEGFAQI